MLDNVDFSCICVTEDSLMSFFKRYSNTLKDVRLGRIEFTVGSWYTTLLRLQKDLKLESFNLDAAIWTSDFSEHWDPKDLEFPDESDGPETILTISDAVDMYVCYGEEDDVCPLAEYNMDDPSDSD